MSTRQQQSALTSDDIWRMLAETSQQMKNQSAEADRGFQELKHMFQESERLFHETVQENKRMFQESERLFHETVQENKRMSQESDRKFQETVQETDRKFQETDRKFQDTDRKFQETDRKFQDTDRKFQDTDRKFQDTDRKFQDTDRLFKAQSRETKRLEELFTSQWGKLMESLVEGDIVAIFKRFGIDVLDTSTRVKGHTGTGQQFEFDIIAHNGDAIVVIEVKTTLRPQYVRHFIDKLNNIKAWLPRYANNTLYGAMAFLTADAGSETMAENLGLIIIRATGNSASIINGEGFEPRRW